MTRRRAVKISASVTDKKVSSKGGKALRPSVTDSINEVTFTSDVVGWTYALLQAAPSLPFSKSQAERYTADRQRRDIQLAAKGGEIVLTGEVKLPDKADGQTPYATKLVEDARKKARDVGAGYFFTWNVNTFVLWETEAEQGRAVKSRHWDVTTVTRSSQLSSEMILSDIRDWWESFLREFAQILRGESALGLRTPGDQFVDALESALRIPVQLATDAIELKASRSSKLRAEIDAWMKQDQGWLLSEDAAERRDLYQRAAKFTSFALVNKLVFYEALMKRYGDQLLRISVPEHISNGDQLHLHLRGFFADARRVTGDYETVFDEEEKGIGGRLPFYSDSSVPYWRSLIDSIHEFDFSRLDYEVIGSIFERLISPEERHKFGQFYTRVEIVDLINSFALPNGDERVIDPACGGGTFLVRAYARKRSLRPGKSHSETLREIYGVDQSPFATHLSVINLATRDLIDDENYPQVGRSDFFDVLPHKSFISLPRPLKTAGLGSATTRDVVIDQVDAVVGNPPYVRQEDIPKSASGKLGAQPGTKEYYKALVKAETGLDLSGRSDLHCYFWPHGSKFLRDGGHLAFITSSQWLDVEYGFPLQGWLLSNFEIVAVIESTDEPWFVGARVATTVCILRKCGEREKRDRNVVRFVQVKRRIGDLMESDGTTSGAIASADALRDRILSAAADVDNDDLRVRMIPQRKLWDDGVRLGQILDDPSSTVYHGGKWGVYVRAPHLWFDLLRAVGAGFCMLGDIVRIRRGITTGKDDFFMPRDVSASCLEGEPDSTKFELRYSVRRKLVEQRKVLLVSAGEADSKQIFPIEAEYLEPEVHTLMEVTRPVVRAEECKRMILLVPTTRAAALGPFVAKYLKWGERTNVSRGTTVSARQTADRDWYDLTGHPRGQLFWPKSQQYRHIVPVNVDGLQANCNLYDLSPEHGLDVEVIAGILNSTIVLLSKFQFGRPVGVEAALKTEVVDIGMMLVPDPRSAPQAVLSRVKESFRKLRERESLAFLSERRLKRMNLTAKGRGKDLEDISDLSELSQPDRAELDDAVLELLGLEAADREVFRRALYEYLERFFESARAKEEAAISNKKTVSRRAAARPEDLAKDIFERLRQTAAPLFVRYEEACVDLSRPFDTFEIPTNTSATIDSGLFETSAVNFVRKNKVVARIEARSVEQRDLLLAIANAGISGVLRVPVEQDAVRGAGRSLLRLLERRRAEVNEQASARTSDAELKEELVRRVLHMLAAIS